MLPRLLVFALLFPSLQASAQVASEGAARAERWNGWITDDHCGAKGANAEHKECAEKCFKKGVKLVLYSSQDNRLYELDRPDLARENLGHPVTVIGTLAGNLITIASIGSPEEVREPEEVKIETATVKGRIIKVEKWTIPQVAITMPDRSLDGDGNLRVALYLPPEILQGNTSWYMGWWDNPSARIIRVDVDFATPFAEALTRAIRRIFPRCEVVRSAPSPGTFDVVLQADLRTVTWELRGATSRFGFALRASLAIQEGDLTGMDLVEAIGSGKSDKFHWSTQKTSEDAGSLLQRLLASSLLNRRVAELVEKNARPCTLVTEASFDDGGGLLPNGRLDAGETARLVLRVRNEGPGPALDVRLRVVGDSRGLGTPGEMSVGDIARGSQKEVSVPLTGTLDLRSALAKLRIEMTEKRGYGARPVLFELATGQLVPPKLEIADVTLNDRSGRAKGDGDGQPGNGETIEAVIRVRNAGAGEAAGVSVTMASPKGMAEILEPKIVLPRIAANGVGEARLLFRLPINVLVSELSLTFQAVDARGTQVASASKEQTWKTLLKRPAIELAYRLYDGGSAGSTGNRDGKVNNGERIEVAVTPTNRGELPARGVRIAIESDDSKLVPQPAVLEVGDLPAQAEGTAQRFAFEVPRGYRLDRPEGDLHFSLVVSQQDFSASKEPVSFAFHALRPDFSLEAETPASVIRGTASEIVLRLRNSGALRAEDVVVEATSEMSGVDLLDERGVPVRSRKIAVGVVEPGSSAPLASLSINVRRNAALGPAPVHIILSQKEFPQLSRTIQIAVAEETASVIAAPQSEEPATRPASVPAPMASATISFLQNTPGQHVTAETVVLRFEVQSPVELTEVRLTQNERLLPLEAARRLVSTAGGLQAVQYELRVQLADGENRFEVVVVTRQGLRSARSLSLNRDREVGRIWVVAVGVSKYQDPSIPSLGYADADARAIYDYFRDTFGLPANQIFLRTNEQATLREIKSILGTQLAGQANDPRDTVVLYFAGHGMRDRVTGSFDPDGLSKYFLPYDTSRTDLYSTALEMDEITNILRRLVPERVVVLLDSCFSGAAGGRSPFDPKAAGERVPISGEFLDRMAHVGKGRVVLTASGPDESAQESSDFGHGVFTYFLLEGLHGAADLNGDGDIDVHEIYAYTSKKVGQATRGKQNPKLKEPDLVGQILIGRGAVHRR